MAWNYNTINVIIKQALTGSQNYPLSTHIFGIPWEVVLIAIIVLIIAGIISVRFRKRNVLCCLIWVEYIVLGYLSTVIFRPPKEVAEIRTELFWGYKNGFHDGTTFPENFLNVLFFIPIGYLFCLLVRKHRIGLTLFVGFCFSLVIEVSQYFFKKGAFDIDDLINNTIGTFVGCLLCMGLDAIRNLYKGI